MFRYFLFILLASCSKDIYQDPELFYYASIVKEEAELRNKLFVIEDIYMEIIEEERGDVIAYCRVTADITGVTKKINVYKRHWLELSDLSKESVMMHELGHCTLNREHDDRSVTVLYKKKERQFPFTVMNTYGVIDEYFNYDRTYYYNEFLK